MSEQIASQSEDVQEPQKGLSEEQYAEVMKELGYSPTPVQKAADEPTEEEEDDTDPEAPPATEEPKNVRKVKFNKKEVEIEEDKIDEYLQKGLALDKEREKKSQYEKQLLRAAKLEGYETVEDYVANLDKIEQDKVKKKQDQFADLKQQLRAEAEEAGLDPDKLDAYLDNHPLFNQAKEVLEREEKSQSERQKQAKEQESVKAWESLFSKYPNLADEMNEDGASAPWMTEEFIAKVNRGYDPTDAYELLNRDKLADETRKKTEQEVLKQQRLNKRAKVEGNATPEPDDGVPDKVKAAFAAFGLNPNTAKKHMRK